jgi:Ca2+-binding RTX toxin-like protein
MPTLTVNIAPIGTQTAEGPSVVGHMWYEMTDSAGNTTSYGWHPLADGFPIYEGVVKNNDSTTYGSTSYSETITISDSQFLTLQNFGQHPLDYGFSPIYNGATNSCVDFVFDALRQVDPIVGGALGEGLLFPDLWLNKAFIDIHLDGITVNRYFELYHEAFITALALAVASPLLLLKRDPLVLDLNGDGVEVSSLSGSSVHFDYNGDGFAELTGWVSADDGILAIDDNNNGVIDNGLELFGSSTQDGFAVLEKLDTNGDGKIDAQDADFGKLLVWRDLNQNGISDPGELKTLAETGVASISLHRNAVNGTNQGNGVGFEAVFTRADGSTGVTQSIYFQTDGQKSIADHTPDFTLAEGVDKLPQLPGSGLIDSIAYRATSDADFRDAWTALTDNAVGMTPSELHDAFQALLLRWAGVDSLDSASRGPFVDARHLAFVEKFEGNTYRETERDQEVVTYPTTLNSGANIESAFQQLSNAMEVFFLAQVAWSVAARDEVTDAVVNSPYTYFSLLDFNVYEPGAAQPGTPANIGMVVDFIAAFAPATGGAAIDYLSKGLIGLEGVVQLAFNGDRAAYAAAVLPHLDTITDSVLHDIAAHIVDGTALLGTTHAEGMNGTSGNDVFIGGGGGDVVSGGAGSDIYVYAKHDGDLWINDDGNNPTDNDKLVLTDLNSSDLSFDRVGNDLLLKVTETGKTVTVENFFANEGIETLRFSDGTDWGRSQITSVTVFQGDGHNNVIRDSNQDDVIHGGTGDDQIYIGAGNDTILYGKGDGYDLVTDGSGARSEVDTFVLTDLNPGDVQLSRTGGDLILTVTSNGQYVDFTNFFPTNTGDWNTSGRNIDVLKFADGTTWDRTEIQQNAWYRGTDRGDTINAAELNDTIQGGKGDDVIQGGGGSDSYIWYKGDGNDQISDSSSIFFASTASDIDTLYLKDVTRGEVSFSYQGNTLLVSINSTGEIITVPDFLDGVSSLLTGAGAVGYGIESIVFADGSSMDRQQITYQAGEDYIGRVITTSTYVLGSTVEWSYITDEFGHTGNIVGNQVQGGDDVWIAFDYGGFGGTLGIPNPFVQPVPFHGEGNNSLKGGNGNDILAAGPGDDVLSGGSGNDILYGDGIVQTVNGGNDIIDGGDGDDTIYGGGGMDLITGGAGNDHLYGGAGKDYISGGMGDDVYIGGKGDDVLIGNEGNSAGSDTYIYARGDGNDTIIESGATGAHSETDVLQFTDIDPNDVELSRVGDDLLVRIISTDEIITVTSHFYDGGPDNNSAGTGIEFIRFADGEQWDRAAIQEHAWFRGTDGRDVIAADTTNAKLDDTIDGGKGDDLLFSNGGSDTFIYARGDGNDTVYDNQGTSSSNDMDRLKFTDIESSDVQLTRSGDDLLVKILSTGETITVLSQFTTAFSAAGPGLELIQFSDGEQWDREQIQQKAWYRGTDGNDFIQLSGWNDTVEGGKGDDLIYSGYQSASGNDTFIYSKGDGNDTIREETWRSFSSTDIDTLLFKDINPDDIILGRSGSDLLIKIGQTNETITILNQFSEDTTAPGEGLEFIQFANGDQWGRETILGIATSSSPFIAGTDGNDTIVGSFVAQNIYGEAGNDTIDGQGGSDLLYGGLGNDTFLLSVSAPGDLITVNGGVGTDTLDLTNFGAAVWVDLVTNGAEVRTTDQSDLTTGTWRDVAQVEQVENVTGTAFADQISGDAGNNVLIGGGGADTLDGRSGDDILIGGAGNDILTGGMGADRLDGGDGADVLNGGLGQDTLIGGAGDDILTGGADGNVFVFGAGSGADIITDFVAGSGANHDLIRFDRAVYSDYASVLAAAAQVGSDVVISDGNGNTITLQNVDLAALTADNFEFRRLDNQAPTAITVDGGTIAENSAAGTVVATLTAVDAGDAGAHTFSIVGGDNLFEMVGNEIRVKNGAVVDFETAAQHALNIRVTDDDGLSFTSAILIGITDQVETQTGTAANDVLTGGAGADILIGGAGNDRLVGGAGSDEYRYNAGDGNDRIVDIGNASDVDRLVLGAGIDASSVVVGRSSLDNSDAVLLLATGETIVLQGQLSNSAATGLEEIKFADNSTWSRADILSRLDPHLIVGSAQDETLSGSQAADVFVAGTGNETLKGSGGADTYRFGASAGNDVIIDGNDDATNRIELVGLDLNDVKFLRDGYDLVIKIAATGNTIRVVDQFNVVAAGVEQIAFADATVWERTQIFENSATPGTGTGGTVVGTPGDDVLQPGLGNNLIEAGAGSDTIIYALGDGSDTINDGVNSPTQVDVLRFVDLNANDVVFSRQGSDLTIGVVSSGEVITVVGQFISPSDFSGIEQVQFANGTVWDKAQITAAAWIRGTSSAETLNGTSDADVIDGKGGNDYLHGGGGGDTYIYGVGSGNDTVDESSGDSGIDVIKLLGLNSSDILLSRSGNDLLIQINSSGETLKALNQFSGTNGIEQVAFADGTTWDRTQIFNAAWVRGTPGNDSINGSADAEIIDGKGGNDYLHGGGGGDTYIYGVGSGNDTVDENGGDTGTDVISLIALAVADVLFSRSGNDLLIQINSTGETLTVSNQFNGTYGIEQVLFADNTIWDRTQIAQAAWIRGTSGIDSIHGSSADETIAGGHGNDYLQGNDGNDTYIYASGDGNDEINDQSASTTQTDTLKFTNLNQSDLTISRIGNDLYVGINPTGETIKIDNQFYSTSANWGIEKFQFADGSSWDLQTVNAHGWFRGTSGNDSIVGSSFDDVLAGGRGNDALRGNDGNDTYIYYSGDGNDTIDDQSASTTQIDTLQLMDLNESDVTVSRVSGDLVVSVIATGETIKVANEFYSQSADWGIEKFLFANGDSWDLPTIEANAWYRGTTGNDSIYGTSWDETFAGGLGNDYLQGNDGNDTYVYASGSGNDEINDRSASTTQIDTLKFTNLNPGDLTLSRIGSDLYVGINPTGETIKIDSQFYSTSANWGIEKFQFADGSSWDLQAIDAQGWFRGTSGNDTIVGSSSDDTLVGGHGSDTLKGTDGNDTYIYASGDGNDTIDDQFPSTTQIDTLKLTDLNASDLTLSRVGGDLMIGVNPTGETIKIANQFYSPSSNWGIEKIQFADGSSWNLQTIDSKGWYRGTSGSDSITGSSWDDTLVGGHGNDYLKGIDGNDTYIYTSGDGNDTIDDQSASTTQIDTLKFTDLNAGDLTVSRVGGDMMIGVNPTGETIKVANQFYSQTANYGVEKFQFADGSSWDFQTINANAWYRGTAGNDTISGSAWNDTLAGGAGNDILSGGAGNDTFVFRANPGQDTITDFTAGQDILEFRDGIFSSAAAALAAATASGNNTLITIDASNSVLLQNVALANLHVGDFHIV